MYPLSLNQILGCLGAVVLFSSCGEEKRAAYEGDINRRDSQGNSPLLRAVKRGDFSQVDFLLEQGADPDIKDSKGDTALTHAVSQADLPLVTCLLQKGAAAGVEVSTGGSLLVEALRKKQLAATYLLLRHGARVHHSKGAQGESLLQAATEMGNLSLLKDLQERGAHPKGDEGNGHGLLHVALDQKQEGVLSYLLQQGLDPNRKNTQQDNLVHRCVRKGFRHHLRALKKNGASLDEADAEGWRPIHMAVEAGDEAMVRSLIQLGAQVHLYSVQSSQSLTPLELAFDRHELGIARQLLEQDVPVGDELYQAAKLSGDRGLEIVRLLIEFDASMDPDREGDSPLTCAVREEKDEIVRCLLEAGAPQDRVGPTGQKPFHLAVAREDVALVELLLKHGADANDPFLPTPSEEFLKYVTSQGVAKWALKKSPSLRPLMIAADSGNIALAKLLMKHGASPGKSSKVGEYRFWPLSFAARRQDTDLQQVLFSRTPGKSGRWIRVDLSDQKAVMFEGEKVIFTTRISSGKKGNRTPIGKYVVSNKYRMWRSTLYDDAEMPYFQRLSGGDFGFHYGILPGYPASHGCIRLPMSKAKKLFKLTRGGTYVEIVK